MGCIQTKRLRETTQCLSAKKKLYLDFDVDLHYNAVNKTSDKNGIHRNFIDNENNNDNDNNSVTSFHL